MTEWFTEINITYIMQNLSSKYRLQNYSVLMTIKLICLKLQVQFQIIHLNSYQHPSKRTMTQYFTNSTSNHNNSSKYNSKQRPFQKDFRDEQIQQLKLDNTKLKKLLKQSQAKRSQITKECSNAVKKLEQIENQNYRLNKQMKQGIQRNDGDKYRVDQLKFLNKQLSAEIQQLRVENQDINEKLRYSNEILQKKYQELEQRTFKRMQQAMKRIKKSMHYLNSLTPKEIEKTKEVLIDSLGKSIELLKGKYQQQDYEQQIQQLMNPLKQLQEDNHQRAKENSRLKEQNYKLEQEIKRHRRMQRQLLPQYKEAIQKLKKNLGQVRSQLAENQYDKNQMKKKFTEKSKQAQSKYNELYKQFRKLQLQKKIYQNKLQEMEEDVQQQKQRLKGQNQILKRLYRSNSQDENASKIIDLDYSNYNPNMQLKETTKPKNDRSRERVEPRTNYASKRVLKKNYSTNQLKGSIINREGNSLFGSRKKLQISGYNGNQESSMLSQESLKNQIHKIDQQIIQIQEKLNQQLQMYQ